MMQCTNCEEEIDEDDDQIVEATINSAQRFCHLQCFRCNKCNELLTGWYFEKNGLLYCRKDYYHKYGERCRHCNCVMSGPVMVVAGEFKFHPECFKCVICNCIIGDDESYAYVEQCKLYCNQCVQSHANETTAHLVTSVRVLLPNSNDANSFTQIIEIPPLSNGRQRRINLALREYHCSNGPSSADCRCKHSNRRNSKINISFSALAETDSLSDYAKTQEPEFKISRAYGSNSSNTSVDTRLANSQPTIGGDSGTATGVQISEIDVSYDLDLLHIGDRILEVNGISIKDKSLYHIEQLLNQFCDQVIHLTVEHRVPSLHVRQPVSNCCAVDSSISPSLTSDSSQPEIVSDAHLTSAHQFVNSNGSTVYKSGQKVDYCDASIYKVKPIAHNNTSDINHDEDSFEKREIRPDCDLYSSVATSLNPDHDVSARSKYESIRTNSVTSNSVDNTRKSRSLEKRHRNRERSSSLSRLLESIRLSTDNDIVADNVDGNGLSVTNNTTTNVANNNSHSSTPSYYLPSRNGFPNKANNLLSRTKSFRVEPKSYRIFRAADLVKGALLGKGFFGEVFEVTDKVTKEKMVLKELYHNDREAEANFVREVSILKSLNHKNVLQFIGILYRGKKLNLITEYITGGTLRQLIQDESRPIYWPERINWARDIASGVNYLHSMNLIHRDLNSQNCLVREDGTVVVADFGLSKITSANILPNDIECNENGDQTSSQQMQKINRRRDRRKRYTIVGNPFWMAPEMMHRNKYDERVDIYSFGIILLEIIGSVNADPDVLKRNRDFSVDKKYFLENYVTKSCPEVFWRIAFLCTEMNPDMRPAFHVLEIWFHIISDSLSSASTRKSFQSVRNLSSTDSTISTGGSYYSKCIPTDLLHEIANYSNSLNNFSVANSTPPQASSAS